MTNLKPCPFCGRAPHIGSEVGFDGDRMYTVKCPNCEPPVAMVGYSSKDEAIAKWNHRSMEYVTPTVNLVKHARWITNEFMKPACSFCHVQAPHSGLCEQYLWLHPEDEFELTRYCPHCGAIMDKEEEE